METPHFGPVFRAFLLCCSFQGVDLKGWLEFPWKFANDGGGSSSRNTWKCLKTNIQSKRINLIIKLTSWFLRILGFKKPALTDFRNGSPIETSRFQLPTKHLNAKVLHAGGTGNVNTRSQNSGIQSSTGSWSRLSLWEKFSGEPWSKKNRKKPLRNPFESWLFN